MANRRYIEPNVHAKVWSTGRWGPRRVRVSQCDDVLTAEAVYAALIGDDARAVHPGATGHVSGVGGVTATWEVRPNRVWRRGRLFLRCNGCQRLCARVYQPVEGEAFACRSCWGLTYPSRLFNYRNKPVGRGPFGQAMGITQRQLALVTTARNRRERRARSRERWAARRAALSRRS
jgi:hypothetical protein